MHAVRLKGFKLAAINTLFVERPGGANKVGGRPTYWNQKGDYFLFYNVAVGAWAVEKNKRLPQVICGQSHGVVHSLKVPDLASPALRGNWSEWDKASNNWMPSAGAGVACVGRVKRQGANTSTGSP